MCDAVRKSATWLDLAYPGWFEKVNLKDFDMCNSFKCLGFYVVGNDNGDGSEGYGWKRLTREANVAGIETQRQWADFTADWREAIEERLALVGKAIDAPISMGAVFMGSRSLFYGPATVACKDEDGYFLQDEDGDTVRFDIDALQGVIDELRTR